MYTCRKCGAEYRNYKTLMRHVKTNHPNKLIRCNRCDHVVSTSLKYRMIHHQLMRHGITKDRLDISEFTLPTTPPKGQPSTLKDMSKKKKSAKRLNSTVHKVAAQDKENVQPMVNLPVTPDSKHSAAKSTITPLMSPVSITLGIEDHPTGDISPIRKDLMDLLSGVRRAVSPLPPTPKKAEKVEKVERVDDNKTAKPEKKDSSHLAVPSLDQENETKRHKRFLGAPCLFIDNEEAEEVRQVRKEAINNKTYEGKVLPYGIGCIKKEEKVIFPDGRIYHMAATWIPDPRVTLQRTVEQQTDQEPSTDASTQSGPSFYVWPCDEKSTNTSYSTDEQAVQTEDRFIVSRDENFHDEEHADIKMECIQDDYDENEIIIISDSEEETYEETKEDDDENTEDEEENVVETIQVTVEYEDFSECSYIS